MLKKLLFKYQNKTQLSIAFIGATLGFTFLLISVHYLIRVNQFGKGQDQFSPNAMVIQKKVSNLSSLNLTKPYFSDEEIERIAGEKCIAAVQPIINNNFDISLETDGELIPYMRSEIFVQAVNHELIQMQEEEWFWNTNSEFVPIVLPRDFLIMINTFASAKNIPQISEDLAKSLHFKFTLSAGQKKEWHTVRIVGFTNETSSILVPPTFITYGNNKFADGLSNKVTQLFVTIQEGQVGAFEKYLSQRGLESKESSLMLNKFKGIANALFSIIILICMGIIFLALLVFFQYTQLIISKSKYEIQTLLRIGYAPKQIEKTIIHYFISLSLYIFVISGMLFILSKFLIDAFLIKNGIHIATSFTVLNFVLSACIFGLFILINKLNIRRSIS